MEIKTDLHIHTIASTHAYSTVMEYVAVARERGLEAICFTDHGPGGEDSPHIWHFPCQLSIPRQFGTLNVLYGAECNLMNMNGDLDLSPKELDRLDLVIGSYHDDSVEIANGVEYLQLLCAGLKNPYVDIMGHAGRVLFPDFDERAFVVAAKEAGKLIEINNHTLEPRYAPKFGGNWPHCRNIIAACKELSVPIVVNSDGHFCYDVGDYSNALALLKEYDFPYELIVNRSYATLMEYLDKRPRKRLEY